MATRRDPLAPYRRRRDFERTGEPAGAPAAPRPRRRGLRFVVQKHRASRLHYDLRLEQDGVLRSWAVPKGPSLDPTVKRLAVQVEDHPLEYGSFEGIIPDGEYGGGTVMLWDRGTYVPLPSREGRTPRHGELHFELRGQKLRGAWLLVPTRRRSPGGGQEWLLIKRHDEAATGEDVTATRPRSVASKRLLAEIAWDEGGNVEKAATGDPPEEIQKLLAARPRRRIRHAGSVWTTQGRR